MPLLKLNSSKINYQYSIGADNFIVSEIVNSSCSYEVPIVIRDKQTLDLYFGQSYPGRDYHDELLNNGVSLFLYKPVSSNKRLVLDEYYPVETWREQNKIIHCLCYDEFFNLKTNPKPEEEGFIYVDDYTKEEYIWIRDLGEYISIKQLPQNLYSEDYYESWYNRDTLRLCSNRVFNLSEKYKDGEGDDFFFLEDPYKTGELGTYAQEESSSSSDSFEFYNYINDTIKIYYDKSGKESFSLIHGSNKLIKTKIKDLFPDKSYHVSIILDKKNEDGSDISLNNLIWLEKKSLKTLINSRFNKDTEKHLFIQGCGEIKLIRIFKEVSSTYKNNLISCHPRYKTDNLVNYDRGLSLVQHFYENPDYFEDLTNGDRTLAFSLNFSKTLKNISPKEALFYEKTINGEKALFGRYLGIPIPGKSNKTLLIYFKDISVITNTEIGLDIIRSEDRREIEISESSTWESIIFGDENNSIQKILSEYNYSFRKIDEESTNFGLLIYSLLGTVPGVGFTNISELDIIQNQIITQDILSYETEELKRIEFYSKTLGPNDDNIKVKIEPINYYIDRYRITISRFSYSEVYDLNLYDTPDRDGLIESLDNIITRKSRLVRCKLFKEKPDGTLWKEGDPEGKLPIGEWELKRSYVEDTTNPETYWTALMHMTENTVNEDFFCVPEIERFLRNDGSYDCNILGYFKEYEEILDYCKTKKCQALIGNLDFLVSDNFPGINESPKDRTIYRTRVNDISEKVPEYSYQVFWNGEYKELSLKDTSPILSWQNTFIYNYNLDDDNYLVYFFRGMSIYGVISRPAYYIFLNGILTGNYSSSRDDISYSTPIENSYVEEDIEKNFQIKKTNYLVSNNQVYFYKNYQNHPGTGIYNSTILTRFALSKVSRTLENNKRIILGKQTMGDIRRSIDKLLLELKTTYPIYQNILLSDYGINHLEHSIVIRLSIYIRELLDKPISLDIELNYIN